MRKWPGQPLILYRITEYRADGTLRYKRPLWVIYVSKQCPAPTLEEGARLYPQRFGVEHGLRFEKGDLGLVCRAYRQAGGQFYGPGAEQRVQLWIELVATALWQLFALRAWIASANLPWPDWLRTRKLTPGTVRRLALTVLCKLGVRAPEPQPRGKSPGRPVGLRRQPRRRYRVYRKRTRHAAVAKK